MEADAWGHRLTGEDPLPCGARGASCGRALSARDASMGAGGLALRPREACAALSSGSIPRGARVPCRKEDEPCSLHALRSWSWQTLWTCGFSLHVSFQKPFHCLRESFSSCYSRAHVACNWQVTGATSKEKPGRLFQLVQKIGKRKVVSATQCIWGRKWRV
jgi:hypothetical protein